MEDIKTLCGECKVDKSLKPDLCPICVTQRLMKGKWKLVILYLIKDKPLRFSEIKRALPKVTQAYLSSQLKELEQNGIINRYSYNQVPPKVEYSLSDKGEGFLKIIQGMHAWGSDYISTVIAPDCK